MNYYRNQSRYIMNRQKYIVIQQRYIRQHPKPYIKKPIKMTIPNNKITVITKSFIIKSLKQILLTFYDITGAMFLLLLGILTPICIFVILLMYHDPTRPV
jgi:hypothetical protein